jgi:hypothetical protein
MRKRLFPIILLILMLWFAVSAQAQSGDELVEIGAGVVSLDSPNAAFTFEGQSGDVRTLVVGRDRLRSVVSGSRNSGEGNRCPSTKFEPGGRTLPDDLSARA